MAILSHIPILLQNEDNAVSQKLHKIEVSPSFLELADGLESTVKVTSSSLRRTSLTTVIKTSNIILYTKNYKALYGIYGSNKWHTEAGISVTEYIEKWRGILIQIIKSTTELKQLHSHSCRFHFCSASFFVKTDKRTEETPEN